MRYKNMKKIISCLLVVMMLATVFTACGSSNNTTNGDATPTSSGSSDNGSASTDNTSGGTDTSTEDTTAEKPVVTFSAIDFNSGTSNTGEDAETILNMIKDYTGTDIQISWIQSDVLDEKNTLALANPSTMPMIMTFNGAVNGTVVSAAKDGAFVDLAPYLADSAKYPNLSQANADVNASLTVDGQLIGIYRARDIGRYGVSYRADWAEKLGLGVPQTIDDIYNMLYAFTYNDPDGNGIDDTIGMEMTSYTGPFDIMQTWFGCGNGWAEVDGNLVPVQLQDEYMVALDWFKKIYDDGLLPSDWAVRTTDTWSNGCKTGENGVYIDVLDGGRRVWDYFVTNNIMSVVDNTQFASMNLIGTIEGKTMATSGYNGYFTLSASTCDTEEKIEAALTFLDKMCDDEMITLTSYGLKDKNYEINDAGYLVDTDAGDTALALGYTGLSQLVAYIPNTESTTLTPEYTERQILEKQVKAEAKQYAVFNPALAYLTNSETYSDVGTTIDEIIKQARTQYICGEIDKAGMEAAIQSWLDQGGQTVIDEVNAQYHAN